MARFWLFIANSIGILIVVLLLTWMAGVIQQGLLFFQSTGEATGVPAQ